MRGFKGPHKEEPASSGAWSIRPLEPRDAEWVRSICVAQWAGPELVVQGRSIRPDRSRGLVAMDEHSRPVGFASYAIEGIECELQALASTSASRGIATALVDQVVRRAIAVSCRRVWLVTTNDNLNAIGFFQRRGFRIAAIHRGAVDRSRQLKPAIPRVAGNGIEIHDEIELELLLVRFETDRWQER